MSERTLVIGGGVIGAMSAWYLANAGCEVTVVDRGRFGGACSHGNCGYVSPSHILPLTQPGAVTTTIRGMLKRNSPFAIKPRLSRSFISWMWKFNRRCNQRDMMEAAEGLHVLLQSSKQLYQRLIAEDGIDCEWKERGILFVYASEKEFDEFRHTEEMLRERFGVGATAYDGSELVKIEPALKPGLGGAWHYEGDCHLRPDKLMLSLREKLEARGVRILENAMVEHFVQEHGKARAVTVDGESIDADKFVVATGAWAPSLNDELGFRIPVEPGKGYSLTMPTSEAMPKIPIIFEEDRVAVTPMESKYRIGSTMEFAGYDTSINPKRLGLLRAAAEKYLHVPYCDPVEEEWYGWRPMTWDGKPIIDRCPAMKNVWIAAGHNMLGISLATGTGKLVKEIMLGEEPHIDASHFSVSRLSR